MSANLHDKNGFFIHRRVKKGKANIYFSKSKNRFGNLPLIVYLCLQIVKLYLQIG
jgi:hypothetical protein